MNGPVTELRDRQARASAVRQYRRAARVHREAGAELMASGDYGLAGECMTLADRLTAAAHDERTCVPLYGAK